MTDGGFVLKYFCPICLETHKLWTILDLKKTAPHRTKK